MAKAVHWSEIMKEHLKKNSENVYPLGNSKEIGLLFLTPVPLTSFTCRIEAFIQRAL